MPDSLRAFVEANDDYLLKQRAVQSVGVGTDSEGNKIIIVGVEGKQNLSSQEEATIDAFFPQSIPYEIRDIGPVSAEVLLAQETYTGKHRPVVMGASCGHPDITAGTTGFRYETDDGTSYLGSNNHVLADTNAAQTGDDVLQPGTADGGQLPDDKFGVLVYYEPLRDGAKLDLAIAREESEAENDVLGIDKPVKGIMESINPGDTLIKSGRTTGVTEGSVEQIGASVNVRYSNGETYTIKDCIITGDMSDGGDSGSATWVEKDDGLYAAGRLFAGSSSVTVHHKFTNELANLREHFDKTMTLITDGGEDAQPIADVNAVLVRKDDSGNELGVIQVSAEDESGSPVEEAEVTVSGPEERSKVTGPQGLVAFFDVPVGEYDITILADEFEEWNTSIAEDDFEQQ